MIAGDDPDAKATVTHLLDQFGFDTVDAGPLKEGWRIQRDTPGTVRAARRRNCEEISQRPNATGTCKRAENPTDRAATVKGAYRQSPREKNYIPRNIKQLSFDAHEFR